jgi:viologen exporter family transport system permease protein
VNALLDAYRAYFGTQIAIQLQYRAALAIWLIGLVLEPVIYLVVWTTVAESSGGRVGDYARGDFAAYFIVLMVVNHLTFTWVFYEFEWRIRQGMFSPLLLRPIHPIHHDIASNLAFKLLTLAVILPTTVALVLLFDPIFEPPAWAVAAFVPALLLAFALRFLVEWTLAMAAFWLTRVSAVNQMYYLALMFLSGQIAPLSLFPEWLQALATLLPFRWMVAFPVELLLGRLSPDEALAGFAAQALWIALGFGLLTLAWRAGIRRYSAVGA